MKPIYLVGAVLLGAGLYTYAYNVNGVLDLSMVGLGPVTVPYWTSVFGTNSVAGVSTAPVVIPPAAKTPINPVPTPAPPATTTVITPPTAVVAQPAPPSTPLFAMKWNSNPSKCWNLAPTGGLALANCVANSATQTFSFFPKDSTIQQGGQCLTLANGDIGNDNGSGPGGNPPLKMQACGANYQQWQLGQNGDQTVRYGANANKCINLPGNNSGAADNAQNITLYDCNKNISQAWKWT